MKLTVENARIDRIGITRFDASGDWPAMYRATVTITAEQRPAPAGWENIDHEIKINIPTNRDDEPLRDIEQRAVVALKERLQFLAKAI
ncbi:hypothetical protein [Pseudophaeobacter sp.]|uniref:hypothetical protein n=1 Tax=Pseudophaeobacter sp. TaxID=1971739 RepID=UPI0032983D26